MITLILAQDEDGGIGKNNDLPWPRIKEDMKFFKETTNGHAMIMGRKTFESFGSKPLRGRLNIVLSSSYDGDGIPEGFDHGDGTPLTPLVKTDSIEKAFAIADAETPDNKDIFVIGGGEIYNLSLRYADRILVTKVVGSYEADVFVNLGLNDWVLESSREHKVDDKLVCTFESYRRPDYLSVLATE